MKTILITGGSKGLGFYYVQHLLKLNHKIIVISRTKGLLKNINNPNLIYFSFDLSEITKYNYLYEFLNQHNIDILINNAAIGNVNYFINQQNSYLSTMIDLNITSILLLNQYFYSKNKPIKIINISSFATFASNPLFAMYSCSKSFLYYNLYNKNNNLASQHIIYLPYLKTNFEKKEGYAINDKYKQKLFKITEKIAINFIKNNKKIIFYSFSNYISYKIIKLIPKNIKSYFMFHFQKRKI